MKHLLLMAALFWFPGCASKLAELELKQPQGDSFGVTLAAEYLAYAKSEQEQQREWVGEHFAGKGLRALSGENVGPDELSEWKLPEDRMPELIKARARLMKILSEDIKRVEPQAAAHATVMFDCWANQVAHALDPLCSDELTASVENLEARQKEFHAR